MHDLLLPKGRSASSVRLEQNGLPWRVHSTGMWLVAEASTIRSWRSSCRLLEKDLELFCIRSLGQVGQAGLFQEKTARIQRSTTSTTCHSVNHATTMVGTADVLGSLCTNVYL